MNEELLPCAPYLGLREPSYLILDKWYIVFKNTRLLYYINIMYLGSDGALCCPKYIHEKFQKISAINKLLSFVIHFHSIKLNIKKSASH